MNRILLVVAPLLDAVREFTTTILNPFDLPYLLHRLTHHASAATNTHGSGIVLAGHHGLGFAAASDDQIIDVEVAQDRVDAGPCRDAFDSDAVVVVEDLQLEDRWPEYRVRALELGFRAVYGIPLRAWGQTIGVLDLYRKTPGSLNDREMDGAELMASMGAGYILHSRQLSAQHDLADQLQAALDSRDVIGQAKGYLMAHHGISAESAFDRLRMISQATNTKLRDVASDLLERDVDTLH